jgi:hypothetical protein
MSRDEPPKRRVPSNVAEGDRLPYSVDQSAPEFALDKKYKKQIDSMIGNYYSGRLYPSHPKSLH